MPDNQAINTLGLSPETLGSIDKRQITRDKNTIEMLGKMLTHRVSSARQLSDDERNQMLNRLTEA